MSTSILLGYEIIDHGGAFTCKSPSRREYEVTTDPPSCTCSDFVYRRLEARTACKHIRLCEGFAKLAADMPKVKARPAPKVPAGFGSWEEFAQGNGATL